MIKNDKLRRTGLLLILLIVNIVLLLGQEIQNSSNIWYFGDRAGLDFNTFPPTALADGQINTQEGVASISNNSGELLFYTDGITVWDRNHQSMPNANGTLNGHFSSTQSALIVPHPGFNDLFYIFTTDELGGANGLSYSVVDMTLPGNGTILSPLGNVVSSALNIQLISPVTEKITGILKPDNSGYWLVTHGWNNNRFYAYNIACNGINPTPVISEIGNIHAGGSSNINAVGYMRSTIDGQKLALVNRNNNSIDVYDFDVFSGVVSNEIEVFPNLGSLYGIEFSPSGEYLYIGGTNEISRYSFNTGSLIDVNIDNYAPFSSSNGVRALQLGPDKNIYVSIRNWDFISIIYNPDQNSPTLTTSGVFLNPDNNGRNCRFGLPNIFYFDLFPPDSMTISTCPGDPIVYNGEIYQPGSTNEVHLFDNQGCDSTIILLVEEFEISDQVLEFDACEGTLYNYNGTQIPAGSQETLVFTDNNGCDSTITVIINEVDIIEENIEVKLCEGETFLFNSEEYMIGTDTVFQFIDQNGCENFTSLKIELSPPIIFDVISENACWNINNGSISIENIIGGISPIAFSIDGQNYFIEPSFDSLSPNIYTIYVRDSNLCVYNMEFEILETPEIIIEYQETSLSCNDDSVLLLVDLFNFETDEVTWSWSNGSENNFIYISQPGEYRLEVSNHCQTLIEDFNIDIEEDERENFIYIPNVFSPNGDGVNDDFKLFPIDDIELINFELQIFNRWGEKVFLSHDINNYWDGTFKEEQFNPGVYVWWLKVDAIVCKRNINIYEKGEVTIIR